MTRSFRFAPSPTGFLHLGNLRPALLNWCLARRVGGRFILRFDDTDRERSEERFVEAAREDLRWFGVTPDLEVRQSSRLDRYALAADRLRAEGRLYPCYETAEELERMRALQRAARRPPIYDRSALRLTDAKRRELEAHGRRPHWRFRLSGEAVEWIDGIRGEVRIDTSTLSDPICVREDDAPLYTFASVIDDIELGITDIVRGEDHVTNSAVQAEIFAALGAPLPAMAHHNLLVAPSGEGFSKREGSLSLRALREAGHEAMSVAALAVLSGTSEPLRAVADLDELASLVSLEAISRAPAKVDPADLSRLDAQILARLDFATVRPRLEALGLEVDEPFWLAVRPNIVRLQDAAVWDRIVAAPDLSPAPAADHAVLQAAAARLPAEPWDAGTWKLWTSAVAGDTGAKGKALFLPLRRALTGLDHGPELAALLPLIGRERAAERLARAMESIEPA